MAFIFTATLGFIMGVAFMWLFHWRGGAVKRIEAEPTLNVVRYLRVTPARAEPSTVAVGVARVRRNTRRATDLGAAVPRRAFPATAKTAAPTQAVPTPRHAPSASRRDGPGSALPSRGGRP